MSDKVLRLVLKDQTREVVDDFGRIRSLDGSDVEAKSRDLVKKLEERLGKPSHGSELSRRTGSAQFGGGDILQWTHELSFALGAGGGLAGAVSILKAWLDLKKARRIRIEETQKGDTSKKIAVDITGFDEAKIQQILKDSLGTLAREGKTSPSVRPTRLKAAKKRASPKAAPSAKSPKSAKKKTKNKNKNKNKNKKKTRTRH